MVYVVFAVVFIDDNRAIVPSPTESIVTNFHAAAYMRLRNGYKEDKGRENCCARRAPPTPRRLITLPKVTFWVPGRASVIYRTHMGGNRENSPKTARFHHRARFTEMLSLW